MDAPTSGDRAQKMEMRQGAAAVAAAAGPANIVAANARTTASDPAGVMLSLSMGPITAGYKTSTDGLASAVPHAETPVTPKAHRKGKGRAVSRISWQTRWVEAYLSPLPTTIHAQCSQTCPL